MEPLNRKIKYHKRPGRYISQEVRDAQAAAVNRTWLEPCGDHKTPKRCQCNLCEDIVTITPHSVARGYSCKPCSAKRNGIASSRSQEEWNALALKMNAKWLDPIVNKKEKATICCLDCNHEWQMRPDAVFHKARTEREMPWCPECSKVYRNERALDNGRKHGTSAYTHGCRCFVCTEAKAKESARYRLKKKQLGK